MTGDDQVFVRDLDSTATRLASVDPSGQAFGLAAFAPSLSADGTKVAFNAETSTAEAGEQAWLRNVSAGTTTLVSVGRDGSTPARLGAFGPSLSGAGDCVAFGSRSDDLASPSYGPDFNHVYLRALARGCPAGATPGRHTSGRPRHRDGQADARQGRPADPPRSPVAPAVCHGRRLRPRYLNPLRPHRERVDDDHDHPARSRPAQRQTLRRAATWT